MPINLRATDELNINERADTDAVLLSHLRDLDTIDRIKEMARERLLAILSEARTMTVGIDDRAREKLMDDLTANFHPDQAASDLFSEGFSGARDVLREDIYDRTGEWVE